MKNVFHKAIVAFYVRYENTWDWSWLVVDYAYMMAKAQRSRKSQVEIDSLKN